MWHCQYLQNLFECLPKAQAWIFQEQDVLCFLILADMLAKKTGRHYTAGSLQSKITASSLRFDEMEDIAELLGYEIKIERKK